MLKWQIYLKACNNLSHFQKIFNFEGNDTDRVFDSQLEVETILLLTGVS